jgi:hypothetical protein
VSTRSYAHVPYPWRAAVDLTSPHPARFYAALIGQAMRYILPTKRRFGGLWGLAARRGLPERALVRSFGAFPRRRRPELEALVPRLAAAWPSLVEKSTALAPWPGEVALLALERRAGLTVFVFGSLPRPLVVLKIPSPGHEGVDREARALQEATPTALAPRYLGRVDDVRAQEAIDGRPLRVEPMTAERAGRLDWPEPLSQLADGFVRLAGATSKPRKPTRFEFQLERALSHDELPAAVRRRLAAAWRDVSRIELSSLGHGDSSPQNCLFVDQRLSGLVDWERADTFAVPGLDVWNAALSYVVLGVGLARWSQPRVVDAFAAAWTGSRFFEEARAQARRAAAGAGYPEGHLDSLEIAFFGYRLERRLTNPQDYPTTHQTAARMLELACAD